MKKLYILLMSVSIISMSSCSDYLDTEPKTQITDENFYKTKADAEKAIVGCYDGLQQVWNSGVAFPVSSEICSDNTFGGTGIADSWSYQVLDEFDLSIAPSENNIFNENWKAYYAGIYRCNKLLSKMDQINWNGDTEYRDYIEAQARFLRAYMYFDMVRLWENIPLITVPTEENVPQSAVDDVYKLIAEDLLFASKINSEAYSSNWAESNDGRVNKWAAKSLLARVYLFYTGYYGKSDLVGIVSKSDALTGLEDVINNGGYNLLTDYATLWPGSASYKKNLDKDETKYAGKGNAETVFAIKYNYTSNYDGQTDGNNWLVMLGLRQVTAYPYSKGWGACTVVSNLWNSFETNDQRRNLSIINITTEKITPEIKDQRDYTGFSNKKYTPIATIVNGVVMDAVEALGAVNFMIGQYQDYVSIRYSDVLLMAAELGSANAQTYFDNVRKRSGLTSKPVTVDNIMEERRHEFAFEGHRYYDLLRMGIDKAAQTLATNTTVMNGGVNKSKVILSSNVLKTRGFQQIPQDQIIQSNNVLKQNSGW